MNENTQFTAHHLRFEVEALTPLVLPAHAGPSIRGALWAALQRHFCPESQTARPSTEHKALCPVCWLMATDRPGARTGRDVPRPYTVEPPVQPGGEGRAWRLEPGARFAFGLTLYAQALRLFPYLVVAMPLMGQAGIGLALEENGRRPGQPRRGQFVLRRIEAVHPLRGEVAPVMGEGETLVHLPDLPVTAQDVAAASQALLARLGRGEGPGEGRQLQLRFWTPTRLVEAGRLVHRPRLGPLVRRLLERLDALRGEYAGEPPVAEREALAALADRVRMVKDGAEWIDLQSRSRRLGRSTPVGGFVGPALYEAGEETWQALLPYLLWGQTVHVGKNATKGDGWFQVEVPWQSSNI
jgi:hypothetical protein